jgi:hypothetical protein
MASAAEQSTHRPSTQPAQTSATKSTPARSPATPKSTLRRSAGEPSRRTTLLKNGGWAGAGAAASHFAGPAGSAAVGAAKYRRELKAGWRSRTRAMAKIGVPIAIGAAAGPVGSAGYAAFEHRAWIKEHVFRKKPKASSTPSPKKLQPNAASTARRGAASPRTVPRRAR